MRSIRQRPTIPGVASSNSTADLWDRDCAATIDAYTNLPNQSSTGIPYPEPITGLCSFNIPTSCSRANRTISQACSTLDYCTRSRPGVQVVGLRMPCNIPDCSRSAYRALQHSLSNLDVPVSASRSIKAFSIAIAECQPTQQACTPGCSCRPQWIRHLHRRTRPRRSNLYPTCSVEPEVVSVNRRSDNNIRQRIQ